MLTENKFSKYLIYAIGEIILVVIGILIALQLNNYNDSLSQNDLEQKAIHNLKLDFEYNKSELNKAIGELTATRSACFTILNQTGNKHQETFDVDSLLQEAPSLPQYYPQNGFLMDLINSGNLGMISDDDLRYTLSSWLPSLETLKNTEDALTSYNNLFIQFIIKNGSWLNSDEATSDEVITVLKFPKSGFEINNNDLLYSIEFENMIENMVVYQSQLLTRQEACLQLAESIIKLLESEAEE